MNLSAQNDYGALPLFLVAAVFILVAPVFWLGVESPGAEPARLTSDNADLYRNVCPALRYGFSRLRAGELPLWNPYQLCGTPFFANPTHGLLQPLNAVFLFLDVPRALALHAFIALSCMGFFFVLFMRSMRVRYIPAILGGIVYACSGASAAAISRPTYANALVWMPLLCWALRVSARHGGLFPMCAGTLAFGLLLLSGSPMLTAALTGFAALYTLGLVFFGGASTEATSNGRAPTRIEQAGAPLTMFALALLLTSIQWVPALAWIRTLDAPGTWLRQFWVAGEFPYGIRGLPAQLLEARSGVLPPLGYLGIATLLLLPAAFFHPVPRWERALFGIAAPLLFVGAMTGNASTGSTGFAAAALLYPAAFCISVLAALGADRLFAPRRDILSSRFWGPIVLFAMLFALMFVIAPLPTRGRMLPAGIALLIYVLFRTRWAGAFGAVVMTLFLFIDLSASSANYNTHPFFENSNHAQLSREAVVLLSETALDDRLLVSAPATSTRIHGNIGMSNEFRVAGAEGLPLSPEQRLWWNALGTAQTSLALNLSEDTAYAPLLHAMAVRAVLAADGGVPGLRLRRRGESDGFTVYANENASRRIGWARTWHLALDMPATMEALCDPAFDPGQECVVAPGEPGVRHLARTVPDRRTISDGAAPPVQQPPTIAVHEDKAEYIEIEVANVAPGILIIADSYDPGWRATVNGAPVPILRVNGLFRGVALPAGNHTIRFVYRPRSFLAGAAITLATIGALGLGALINILARRRRQMQTKPR